MPNESVVLRIGRTAYCIDSYALCERSSDSYVCGRETIYISVLQWVSLYQKEVLAH